MNATSEDIADILALEGSLELTLATDLFFARMPDTPDAVVTVYDNPGQSPLLTLDKATSDYYFSSISIQVRDGTYAAGWITIFGIMEFLHGSHGIVQDGTYYALIKALGNPQLLHYDENGRPTFVINFEVQRRVEGEPVTLSGQAFSTGFSLGFK